MAQKKGRGKVPGLSGYYAVLITSSSAYASPDLADNISP